MIMARHDGVWPPMMYYPTSPPVSLCDMELHSTEHTNSNAPEEELLHLCRHRISHYEHLLPNGKNWEYYKKIVNPYELVYTQRKYDNFPESICFLKPLSRSYFKMIEMLDLLSFFTHCRSDSIRTAHVCEGPGGFIEALYSECSKQKRRISSCSAMTLKSTQNNIPGWKRAAAFLERNKTVRILYGEDQTGDIMKPENQQSFINEVQQQGKVHLFTADGGFDFSCDYTKQERMIFPLLVASIKMGMEVLQVGGVMIIKLFDFYQPSTIELVHFVSCAFQEWTLYKPSMSRPCNPEHYLIGKGFLGCSEPVLDTLRIWCSILDHHQPLATLYRTPLPSSFHDIIRVLQQQSFKTQTEYLERVFDMIDRKEEDVIQAYLTQNEKTSYDWCVRFKVPMYPTRYRSIAESHSDPLASSPQ